MPRLLAINAIVGTVLSGLALYYTAASYYGWKPSSVGPMDASADILGYWKIAFLLVGVALIMLTMLQAFGVIIGSNMIRRRPVFITDINIAVLQISDPVVLIGKVALNKTRLRVVVAHSHYCAGLGWAGWSDPWSIYLPDLKDIIVGQQIRVPVVSCRVPADKSTDLIWGAADGDLVNAIKRGTTYRAQIRIIAEDGNEQQPISFLLIRAQDHINVIKQTDFSFISEWEAFRSPKSGLLANLVSRKAKT